MDVITGHEPARQPRTPRWLGTLAAVGIGITLGAAGIAAAADDPTPTPAPTAGSNAKPAQPGPGPGGPGLRHRHGPGKDMGGPGMRGAVHGEFVVPDGTGWKTVAMQRGVVTAVSKTAITVKSEDGYSKTYVVTADTMVNAARDGIGSIKNGEDVAVVAEVKSGTATAVDIRDLTQIREHRKDVGPPPPGGPGWPGAPAPNGTPASPSSFDESGDAQPA
jgi:hypothetical protein